AREFSIEESVLKDYNKWVRQGTIPGDKSYYLFIPGGNLAQDFNNLVLTSDKASKAIPLARRHQDADFRTVINGVAVIKANNGETLNALAKRVGLNVSQFISYNDMAIDQEIIPGTFYFLKKKKKKNRSVAYKAKMGDDLWLVSQKFGVRLRNLRKLNAGVTDGLLASGTSIRLNNLTVSPLAPAPPLSPVTSVPDEVAELSREAFSWGTRGEVKINPPVAVEAPSKEPPADSISLPGKKLLLQPGVDSVIHHEVKKGETFYSIAHQYDVDIATLIKRNQFGPGNPLKPGQVVTILKTVPARADTLLVQAAVTGDSLETITYEVKSSDTLYGIARQFGATIKEIMDWNNKSVFTVTPGEKLRILKR
ncbi:MAG TPA: LysM peptidoglycan-binding domain-containing protein, partial [Cyclobacteriaceae bacterium]|nr:LysM peptidoglycan-binding domain-containing protein [Cyclobacteriaceae bacterium]